ncbi:hypothetical protein [Microbacterium sp. LWH3-1.2]|uniref:hypothetical protein n=1 Tax=Microbacterium sp. LWH3-1.2 TaxID=3135256 RepID=UPI0034264C4B
MAARAAGVEEEQALLERAAMQPPITAAASDSCDAGEDSWKIHDSYYWICSHVTYWVVPEPQPDPVLIIAAYRAHLESIGCEPDEPSFGMAADYWATMRVAGENAHGEPYTVDSLPDVFATCGEDRRRVSLRFGTAAGVKGDALLFAFGGEEVIEQTPFDRAALQANTTPLVVTLTVGTKYHKISRYEDDEPDEPASPLGCACYSGSTCDCPGG